MKRLTIDYSNVLGFISNDEIIDCGRRASFALDKLKTKTGVGSEFTGWIDYPLFINFSDILEIEKTKEKIVKESKCLLVVGIGGSYLGSKALIEALNNYNDDGFCIKYIGNNMSSEYITSILDSLEEIDFSVNVISKSGKTLEAALGFELVLDLLKFKYKEKYNERVYITTTKDSSLLYREGVKNNYKIFTIPNDIGGRYSVLTIAGLLPIACAGFDIKELLEGAIEARSYFLNEDFNNNEALIYATLRNLLYNKGKKLEFFVTFEPNLSYLGEWWKQLFAESEGKERKGIFPVTTVYSTDLHSIGQYVQDGERIMFETFLNVEKSKNNLIISRDKEQLDELYYLNGLSVNNIQDNVLEGVIKAHKDGGVPCIIINLRSINEHNFGYLVYFYMLSCAVSGYMLGVNPFNQDGVEAYKKNVHELLNN